ncbi:MAG: topoisomerase C-terminal repeat-containing protein, partial [Bacilli bacterium]|nr:topoisomerase C-terminal repeat-containing protein [Bacilli bacterium]
KKDQLSEDEFIVYQTVFKRFVAVFCSIDCEIEKTEIKIKVGDYEEFNLKGTIIVVPGWTKYDDTNTKDKILPNLNVGDEVVINFKPKEKETTPPKHYTIETLNNYLKNPFKEDKKRLEEEEVDESSIDDTEDYKAIFEGLELGTEATRTGIIDNAIKSKYIELKKDVYYILPDGEYLINSLIQMEISMDKYKTSEMGKALKKVFHDEIGINDAVSLATDEISSIFNMKNDDKSTGFYGEKIGVCPKCGNDIIKGKYYYGCKDYKNCNFRIPITLCGRVITLNEAKDILENRVSKELDGFVSKKGTNFKAKLKIDDDKIVFDFN